MGSKEGIELRANFILVNLVIEIVDIKGCVGLTACDIGHGQWRGGSEATFDKPVVNFSRRHVHVDPDRAINLNKIKKNMVIQFSPAFACYSLPSSGYL